MAGQGIVYRVATGREDRPVAGTDSCIASVPPGVYVDLGDGPVIDVQRLGRVLRALSEKSATDLGEELHHAVWVITGDPEVVESKGMHDPECGHCRSGVDQALGHLAAHPGAELLVGTLYWAG